MWQDMRAARLADGYSEKSELLCHFLRDLEFNKQWIVTNIYMYTFMRANWISGHIEENNSFNSISFCNMWKSCYNIWICERCHALNASELWTHHWYLWINITWLQLVSFNLRKQSDMPVRKQGKHYGTMRM